VELVHVEDHASGGLEMHGARRRDDLEDRSSRGRGFITIEDRVVIELVVGDAGVGGHLV
jgi:hypothetical protein